jgi:hypothetical protein
MSSKFKVQSSKSKVQSPKFRLLRFDFQILIAKHFYFLLFTFAFCLLSFCLLLAACSIPNLEEAECTASRDAVKEFYSFHFGNEMRFSPENLRRREKFLTAQFVASLQNLQTDADVFTTNSTDYPKAFRTGGCRVVSPEKTEVEVLLFWKTDTRSEQKAIQVEAVKENNKWLINKIR